MEILSTNFTTIIEDVDKIMTGKERYPIFGGFVSEKEANAILSRFVGLNLYWQCLPKAEITKGFLGIGEIVIGEIKVFHAWVEITPDVIIDFALPGLIEKGLNSSDEIGPYIVDRDPIILAGKRPDWIFYKKIEYL
jgi:hypothetical protein